MTSQEIMRLYIDNKLIEGKKIKFFKDANELKKHPYNDIFEHDDDILFGVKKFTNTVLFTQNGIYMPNDTAEKHRVLYEDIKTYNIDAQTGELFVNALSVNLGIPLTKKETVFFEKLEAILDKLFAGAAKSKYKFYDTKNPSKTMQSTGDNPPEAIITSFEYNADYSHKAAQNFKDTLQDGISAYDMGTLTIADAADTRIENILKVNGTQLDNEVIVFFAADKFRKDIGILFTSKRVVGVFYDQSRQKIFKVILYYSKTEISVSVKKFKFSGLDINLHTGKNTYNISPLTETAFSLLNLYLSLIQSAEFLTYYHRDEGAPKYSGRLFECFMDIVETATKSRKPLCWERKTEIKPLWHLNNGLLLEYDHLGMLGRKNNMKISKENAVWNIDKERFSLIKHQTVALTPGGQLPQISVMMKMAMPLMKTNLVLDGQVKSYIVNMYEKDRFMLGLLLNR